MQPWAAKTSLCHLTVKGRRMVPTRKTTELEVNFNGRNEIYRRTAVFKISGENPDKSESSEKEEESAG